MQYRAITTSVLSVLLGTMSVSAQVEEKSTVFTDSVTGISLLGFQDAKTGFQFGMALPEQPTTDMIVNLVTPLTKGAGWGGVGFGAEMTGPLLLVAWPNGKDVQISPRVATGYEISNGANPYTTEKLTFTPIPKGTFVNSTHVAATFVCGGCLNKDSFTGSTKTATFGYAVAAGAVDDPTDKETRLSDHTATDTPYGNVPVTIAQAQSAQYATWAKMTGGTDKASGSTGSNNGTEGASPAAGSGSSSSAGGSGSSDSSSSSGAGSSSSTASSSGSASSSTSSEESAGSQFGTGYWVAMMMVFLIYMAQPFLH
ncbi:hypothetical protein GGR56DRAFT_241484 [Xylariaceae sp. FL0804]|nr:hypothetical protein GGR56DRAFT_241484 [Xylariaceae sp. FL0804]